MGLLKAVFGSLGGAAADQWREFFYCDALDEHTLAVKGQKRTSRRSANTRGNDNIISDGSIIAVADGQCMILVDQGRITEFCAEPGEYVYDSSTEPSIFYGSFSEGINDYFRVVGKRIGFGAEAPKDQRVYYFNTKEVIGNRYGTPNPIPFRIVDANVGLDIDISITCFGEFSYRISNPLLFYANVCGNVLEPFRRERIDSQLETELLTALQPAFAKISKLGVRYSELPAHTQDLVVVLNDILSDKWRKLRGVEVVSMGLSGIRASEKDENLIKELQRTAVFRNPTMAAAELVGAQAAAMQAAATNEGAGAAMAFLGMNMAANAGGVNPETLFKMGMSGSSGQRPSAGVWTCTCGATTTGKFCPECGTRNPMAELKCINCGWKTEEGNPRMKFCPECGSPLK